MSTMIIEVYEAFKSAGATEEKAQAAAKALADFDTRFNKIDGTLDGVRNEITGMRWMQGIAIALNLAILGLIINTILAK